MEGEGQGIGPKKIRASSQWAKIFFWKPIDGTAPDLIMDILKSWMESLLHEQETKYKKVIEAIMAIQSGDNPHIVGFKLEVIY